MSFDVLLHHKAKQAFIFFVSIMQNKSESSTISRLQKVLES